MKPLLLLIDDDKDFINDFKLLLEKDFETVTANSGEEGLEKLKEFNPDVVLLDLMFEDGINGLEILQNIKNIEPDIPVIMITDYGSIDTAVEAIKLGAFDYISKTPNLEELKVIIDRALKLRLKKYQTQNLKEEVSKPFNKIIGVSSEVNNLINKIKLFSPNENTILITGESGVGKELVARQIHINSRRCEEPFVAINCAALPKDLFESELFGYEKGAFTGASKRKPGKFEIAADGTVFLDEISELDLNSQVKLLRVLQEKEFERVGGTTVLKTNARVIAATNRNLINLVNEEKFREDLFYRLDVLTIDVPPLRKRKEDIPYLIDYFAERTCNEMKIDKKVFTGDAKKVAMDYNWKGNIRELQNFVTRIIIVTNKKEIAEMEVKSLLTQKSEINLDDDTLVIPQSWQEMDTLRKEAADKASRKVEKIFLENLLNKFNGNITQAASYAGINRTNLHKMIKKCGIN